MNTHALTFVWATETFKTRNRVTNLRYVKVEIQCFPRQGLGGAVPDTADVFVGDVTLWQGRLNQTR